MRVPVNYVGIKRGFKNTGFNRHYGIDFGWSSKYFGQNQPVFACDDGVVIYNRYQGALSGGYTIIIRHDLGDGKYICSEYGHLLKDSQTIKEGQKVTKGQKIACMGSSGNSTGCHLHFGLYLGSTINYSDKSKFVDPSLYLNVYSNQVESTKVKNNLKHTKKVKGTDGELNVRKGNLRGKIVYSVKEGKDIESYGINGSVNIVDNLRNYVCSNKYIK